MSVETIVLDASSMIVGVKALALVLSTFLLPGAVFKLVKDYLSAARMAGEVNPQRPSR